MFVRFVFGNEETTFKTEDITCLSYFNKVEEYPVIQVSLKCGRTLKFGGDNAECTKESYEKLLNSWSGESSTLLQGEEEKPKEE